MRRRRPPRDLADLLDGTPSPMLCHVPSIAAVSVERSSSGRRGWARLGSNQRPLACEARRPRCVLPRRFRSRSDSQRKGLIGPPPGDACGLPRISSVIGHQCPLAERPTGRPSPVALPARAWSAQLRRFCCQAAATVRGRRARRPCGATPLPGRGTRSAPCGAHDGSLRRRTRTSPSSHPWPRP